MCECFFEDLVDGLIVVDYLDWFYVLVCLFDFVLFGLFCVVLLKFRCFSVVV